MGEVIVITSGKGGVGKTTTSANIGMALAMQGKSVLLIDADIGLRNLDVALGAENKIVYDLVDVLEQKCRLRQAIIKDKTYENLCLLPASQTRDKYDVTPEKMEMLCREVQKDYDFVLIDCPAGAGRGFENAIAGAQRAVVVTVPEMAAVRDADSILEQLHKRGVTNCSLVINRMRPELVQKGAMLRMEEIVEWLGTELLGVVPEDELVLIFGARGIVATGLPDSRAGKAYKNIAGRLCGEKVPLLEMTVPKERRGIRRLFSRKKA